MPEKPIIGLVGFAGSGKGSLAEILAVEYGFTRIAFADPLREMALAIDPIVSADPDTKISSERIEIGGVRLIPYAEALATLGYTETKARYPEARRFLQRLGTEAGRNILGPNIWVDTAMRRADVARAEKDCRGIVHDDARFDNEVEAIRERGGFIWRIDRPGFGPVNDHESETLPLRIEPDAVIVNDGTLAELAEKVFLLVTALGDDEPEPFDEDGYPTTQALARVRMWDWKDLPGWFAYIQTLWRYDDYIRSEGAEWKLSTGGWSGNESIVGAMGQNQMAWLISWRSSRRGGHYTFEIPAYQMEEQG